LVRSCHFHVQGAEWSSCLCRAGCPLLCRSLLRRSPAITGLRYIHQRECVLTRSGFSEGVWKLLMGGSMRKGDHIRIAESLERASTVLANIFSKRTDRLPARIAEVFAHLARVTKSYGRKVRSGQDRARIVRRLTNLHVRVARLQVRAGKERPLITPRLPLIFVHSRGPRSKPVPRIRKVPLSAPIHGSILASGLMVGDIDTGNALFMTELLEGLVGCMEVKELAIRIARNRSSAIRQEDGSGTRIALSSLRNRSS
jgi:hypothetical protein